MGERGFFVRYLDEVEPVPCYCGSSTRILPSADGAEANFHVTHITDSKRHYHRLSAEIYFVLEGSGALELEGKEFALRPGALAYIPAGVRHRGWGDFRTVVVGIPAQVAGDEYFD